MALTSRELEGAWTGTAAPSYPLPASEHAPHSRRRRILALVVGVAVVVSALAAVSGRGDLVRPAGVGAFADFFAAALHPRVNRGFLLLVVKSTLTTLSYAVLGTAISLVIGLVGGVFTSQTWWSGRSPVPQWWARIGWGVARAALVVPRGIHEVVWGLVFLAVFGLDPIVAVLAIGIPFGAVTAKVFSEILDETARHPYTALLASGASRRSAAVYGLFPPALPDLLSYGFYRFECAIRSAAILGLVGAGGLGFQLALSFQTLRYDEIWTLLYALIALSIAADAWSSTVRGRQAGGSRSAGGVDRVLVGSVLFGAVLVVLSWWWVGLDASALVDDRTWQTASRVLTEAWPPGLVAGGMSELLWLSAITVAMSVLAAAIAFTVGSLLALPAAGFPQAWRGARRSSVVGHVVVTTASKLLLVVLRAIPPPVWALLFMFVLTPGLLPGALALGVYTAGVLGRLMAEATENLDTRPLRALRSHGASGPQIICYGVIPAAAPRFVAYGLYRWEVTIRETVVVGVVGAGGLGVALQHSVSGFHYGTALSVLLAILALTLLVDFASAAMRKTLR